MKRLLLILFAIFLVVSPVQGEFFKDVIVTSPTGIWTDSRAYSSLSDAVAAIGASEQDLYIAKEETVTTLVIPANIRLHFLKDGAIANSNTLTINTKNIHADHQIFTGAGAVNFAPSTEVRTRWFEDFETAITQTSNDTVTLLVDTADTLANSATVGNNVLLKWNSLNLITIAGGQTLSNIGDIDAPGIRLFVVSGAVAFKAQSPLKEIRADWFGSTLATLDIADNAAAAAGKPLVITPGDWVIDSNITLSSYTKVLQGADLQIATNITLTISGILEVGPYQIFTCTGTGKVALTGNIPARLPEWWGAAPDGVTDSTAAIQSAITSLPATKGGVIDFAVGTYLITPGQIVVSTPGTILQGKAAATDGLGTMAGTVLKSAAGVGKMISFLGSAAATPLDSCQANDITFWGNEKTVQGLSLKWVSNFRSRNAWVTECYDHGVYMEQVWDSSFYDLEIESCGDQATTKAGLYIYNGATDNSNNLRFYAFHAEENFGDDVWIDASAAGVGGNYDILFHGGKIEKSQAVGSYSTKAFKISGWTGAVGKPNQAITIRDMGIFQYMVAGDIGIHYAGDGFMTVDNCFFSNNTDGGTGIKIEGPVVGPYTHKLTNNRFANVDQEITIESTTPRNRVWTEGNVNTLWSETDSRIHVNTDLVQDRRSMMFASWTGTNPTVGTGEDILATTTIPAGVLSTWNGIKVHAGGAGSGVGGNKTIKFYFGSEVIEVFPAGAIGIDGWQLDVVVRNGTAGEQWLDWKFTRMSSPIAITAGIVYPLEDTTADVVVKITGECADGGDTLILGTWRVGEE